GAPSHNSGERTVHPSLTGTSQSRRLCPSLHPIQSRYRSRRLRSSPPGPERSRGPSTRGVRGPSPIRRSNRPSVHSGKAQIPREHHPPKSIPKVGSTPSDHSGTAPNPVGPKLAPTPSHTGENFARRRRRRGPGNRSHPAKHSAPTKNYP